MNPPAQSLTRSLIYARFSGSGEAFLSLCLTGRWHQHALGLLWGGGISSSSSKIKEDCDGIISESRHPPTLSLSHDRRLPFPSNRVSVSLLCVRMKIWWSPPSAKPSSPVLYRDPPPSPRLRLLISHFSARNEYLSQKLADRTHVLKCWLNEFFQ